MKKENIPINQLFELADKDILCNTSYPYHPSFFADYRAQSDFDIMQNVSKMSLYFHIPFCQSLCKFCEYTRFKSGNVQQESSYVELIIRQAEEFLNSHPIQLLYGLDIGGGTPTALNDSSFERLLNFVGSIIKKSNTVHDFEASVEFHYNSVNEIKAKAVAENGIHRMSTGIQVYDRSFMANQDRITAELADMAEKNRILKASGIKKINLDIMYGMPGQSQEMLKDTMDAIAILCPEQVTLYETRYNMNGLSSGQINREMFFKQYSYLYRHLIDMGYSAHFGQNTFSLGKDEGVSSYLRYRMSEGIPYRGFGISAQSMSYTGLAYNNLKSVNQVTMPQLKSIDIADNYKLPPEELVAKYVCIALYSGKFNVHAMSYFLQQDASVFYGDQFNFLLENNLAFYHQGWWILTEPGVRKNGAVAALFWSEQHKKLYIEQK